MNDAQKALLEKCIAQLNLLKCKYHIVDADGGQHGEAIEVETPATRNNYRRFGYKDVVAAMLPGDEYVFNDLVGCADRKVVANYASSIAASMLKMYGKGNYTVATDTRGSVYARRIA